MTKISANLPDDAVEALRHIAKARKITMTQVLRDAIALQEYVLDQAQDGGKLLIETKDKKVREVVLW